MKSPKKNKKITKKSILIHCEGKTEVAFLKYIKTLYLKGDAGNKKFVQITSEDGGSLSSMQKTVSKKETCLSIDKSYILLNGDRIKPEDENKINEDVWIAKPCLEGFLLDILGHLKPQTSKACKKTFESKILNAKEKLKYESYNKHFTKSILETKRRGIRLLDQILQIFECEN